MGTDGGGVHTLDEVIANRASAILLGFVTRKDAARWVRMLDHSSEVVRNNALSTLTFLLSKGDIERLVASEVTAGDVSPAAAEDVATAREPLGPLWSYIPNLDQI
jgi:hypothetical protein